MSTTRINNAISAKKRKHSDNDQDKDAPKKKQKPRETGEFPNPRIGKELENIYVKSLRKARDSHKSLEYAFAWYKENMDDFEDECRAREYNFIRPTQSSPAALYDPTGKLIEERPLLKRGPVSKDQVRKDKTPKDQVRTEKGAVTPPNKNSSQNLLPQTVPVSANTILPDLRLDDSLEEQSEEQPIEEMGTPLRVLTGEFDVYAPTVPLHRIFDSDAKIEQDTDVGQNCCADFDWH